MKSVQNPAQTAGHGLPIANSSAASTFHNISKKYMYRYRHEFAFRWTHMDIEDAQRRDQAVRGRSIYRALQCDAMPKRPAKKNHPGGRGDPISGYPLTADQLVRGIFQIKPDDVKRILASKPGKKK